MAEGAAIGGIVAAIGAIGAAAISSDTQSSINKTNLNFSSEQTEKGMEYGREMAATQNQYQIQAEERGDVRTRELMDYIYKNYQSPSAQVEAFRKAGINPAAALGNGSSGFNVGSPSVSQSSPSLPSMPSMPSLNQLLNPAQPFTEVVPVVSDALSKLADSKLKGAESERTERTTDLLIEEMLLKNNQTKLLNDYQQLQNSLFEAFGEKEYGAKIQSLTSEAYYYHTAGDYNKAQKLAMDALTTLRNQEISMNEPKVQMAFQYACAMLEDLKWSVKLKKAQSTESYASANEKNAVAKHTDILSGIDYLNFKTMKRVYKQRIDTLLSSLNAEDFKSQGEYEEAVQRIRQLKHINNANDAFKEVNDCLDWLKSKVPALVVFGSK